MLTNCFLPLDEFLIKDLIICAKSKIRVSRSARRIRGCEQGVRFIWEGEFYLPGRRFYRNALPHLPLQSIQMSIVGIGNQEIAIAKRTFAFNQRDKGCLSMPTV